MENTTTQAFDEVSFIMAFESEEMDNETVIAGFQHLIDSGTVWNLQGSYQRTASDLIRNGYCTCNLSTLAKRKVN